MVVGGCLEVCEIPHSPKRETSWPTDHSPGTDSLVATLARPELVSTSFQVPQHNPSLGSQRQLPLTNRRGLFDFKLLVAFSQVATD